MKTNALIMMLIVCQYTTKIGALVLQIYGHTGQSTIKSLSVTEKKKKKKRAAFLHS